MTMKAARDEMDATVLLCGHGGVFAGLTAALLELPHANWPVISGTGQLPVGRADPAGRAGPVAAQRLQPRRMIADLPTLVGGLVLAGAGNPDGMHWDWSAHRTVGAALAGQLAGPLEAGGRTHGALE